MSVSLFYCHPSGCGALVDNLEADGIAALEGFLEAFIEAVIGYLRGRYDSG